MDIDTSIIDKISKIVDDTLSMDIITNYYLQRDVYKCVDIKGMKKVYPEADAMLDFYQKGAFSHLIMGIQFMVPYYALTQAGEALLPQKMRPEQRVHLATTAGKLITVVENTHRRIFQYHDGLIELLNVAAYQQSAMPLTMLPDVDVIDDIHRRLLPAREHANRYAQNAWSLFSALTLALPTPTPKRTYNHMLQSFVQSLEKTTAQETQEKEQALEAIAKSLSFVVEADPKEEGFKECLGYLKEFHEENSSKNFDRIYQNGNNNLR